MVGGSEEERGVGEKGEGRSLSNGWKADDANKARGGNINR